MACMIENNGTTNPKESEPQKNTESMQPCPFCGSMPLVDWDVEQPNGELGAMHISHSEDCYLTVSTGARVHAGGHVRQWNMRS